MWLEWGVARQRLIRWPGIERKARDWRVYRSVWVLEFCQSLSRCQEIGEPGHWTRQRCNGLWRWHKVVSSNSAGTDPNSSENRRWKSLSVWETQHSERISPASHDMKPCHLCSVKTKGGKVNYILQPLNIMDKHWKQVKYRWGRGSVDHWNNRRNRRTWPFSGRIWPEWFLSY
jgi:hypothetical protein